MVLAACTEAPANAAEQVAELAAGGLRVLAVARRRLTAAQARTVAAGGAEAVEGLCGAGLSLVGFVGIADTPRAEAPQLLADLTERGWASG